LTGKEKCNSCVLYCPTCSKIVEKSNLSRDSSGKMVCKSCASPRRAYSAVPSSVKPIRKISAKEILGE
jgi:Pyruvate/2-oxoacid:ferredoxin oxidoreductase delta subunit